MGNIFKNTSSSGWHAAELEEASILAVVIDAIPPQSKASVWPVTSGRDAIEWLKIARFDLVAVSPHLPDMSLDNLVEIIKQFWPWQRWALITPEPSALQVRHAAEQSAVGIFDSLPHSIRKTGTSSNGHLRFAWSQPDVTEGQILWEASRTMRRS